MEFKSLKNIESSFRQIRLFGIVFLSLCAVVTVWSVWSSYRFAEKQREKIYVLDNGKSLMLALSQDIRQSNVTERSLVTTCRLLNSSRSDDNPNGFTIEGFTIIENKDLQTIKR